jgi:hypothetical protein
MDWADLTNTVHYKTVEQPRNRLRAWWQRHGRPWVRRGQTWWRTWTQARQARQERRPMPTIQEELLFKATAAQIAPDFLAWLKAQHYQEFLDDEAAQAAATERATVALEAEYERRRETLEDALAARRVAVQRDADAELETTLTRERATLARESEGLVEGLKDDARDAQRRATDAETALVGLWRQLLPPDTRTYLFDSGVLELDLTTLNPILQRAGQVAIAYQKATTSTRLVKLKVGEAHYEAAARFWLEAAEPPATRSSGGLVPEAYYR